MSDNPNIIIGLKYDPSGEKAIIAGAKRVSDAILKMMQGSTDASVKMQIKASEAATKAAQAGEKIAIKKASVEAETARKNEESAARVNLINLKAAQVKERIERAAEQAKERAARREARKLDADVAAANRAAKTEMDRRLRNEAFQRRENERKERLDKAAALREAKDIDARYAQKVRDARALHAEVMAQLAQQKAAQDAINARANAAAVGVNTHPIQSYLSGLGGGIAGGLRGLGTGALSILSGVVAKVADLFKSAMEGAIRFIGRVWEVTIGVLIRDMIHAVQNALRNVVNDAINATTLMERTQVSLLTQGRLENQSAGMQFAEAFENARKEAAEYLQVIRELAIYSPFTQQGVQEVYRTFAAYGFAREESIALTEGMLDLSSAFMVTDAEASRASLAIAQILSRGKATGEEIRQLVNSGLPLMNKLAEAIGVTSGELSQMARNGELTNEKMIPALKEIFAEFKGAARSASLTTFSGLMSSLADIGPIVLQEFFSPINRKTGEMEGLFGALIPVLRTTVDFFTNPAVINKIREWGVALGNMAKNAFSWGYNLMVQYGSGIIAAGRIVVRALQQIAKVVSSWLMPHSPPKILPDIDKWGKETMETWLGGFTQADAAGMFSSLSSELEGLMRSVFEVRGADADNSHLPGMILSMNDAIGELLRSYSTGGGLAAAQARLTGMFGGASSVVNDYITALLRLEDANNAVGAAQAELNNITTFYDDKLKAIDLRIKQLQNTQKNITDDSEVRKLNLIINSGFVSEERKAQARARLEEIQLTRTKQALEEERDAKITEAEARLAAAQLEQSKREEQLAAAKMMLDYLQKQRDLYGELADAVDKLADKLGDLGAGGAGDLDSLGGGGFAEDTGSDHGKPKGIFDRGKAVKYINDMLQPFEDKMAEFEALFEEWSEGLAEKWRNFRATYVGQVVTGINPATSSIQTVTQNVVTRLGEAWDKLPAGFKEKAADKLREIVAGMVGNFSLQLNTLLFLGTVWRAGMTAVFTTLGTSAANAISIATGLMTGDFTTMFADVKKNTEEWKADIMLLVTGLIQESEAAFGPWFTNTLTGFQNLFGSISATIQNAMRDALIAMGTRANEIIGILNKLIEGYNKLPWAADVSLIPQIPLPNVNAVVGSPGKSSSTVVQNTTTVTNNYNLGVTTAATAAGVTNNFQKMKILGA